MKQCPRGLALLMLVLMTAAGSPVRRSDNLEARRRSAIDRNLIRFGRSYPAEPSAADLREAFERPARGNSFLRLGRSQPLTLTNDDLVNLLRAYEDDQEPSNPERRATNFVRLGRDPKFIRFGRADGDEQSDVVAKVPQRKGRARDHFVRLGRDSEDVGHEEELFEDRKKRSTDAKCADCELAL